MTSIIQSSPRVLELMRLMQINDLVVVNYSSIYGPAYEILTLDGARRISHGTNKQDVLEKALEFLESRAVLTGVPMRRSSGTVTARAASIEETAQMNDTFMKHMTEKMKQDVLYLTQQSSFDSELRERFRLLGQSSSTGRFIPRTESEEKK